MRWAAVLAVVLLISACAQPLARDGLITTDKAACVAAGLKSNPGQSTNVLTAMCTCESDYVVGNVTSDDATLSQKDMQARMKQLERPATEYCLKNIDYYLSQK